MSEIDVYRHLCIGIVRCPSRFEVVRGRMHRLIPIYRLDEDAMDASSFRAKAGDILLGGGTGESAALRVSIPEAFRFYTDYDSDDGWPIDTIVYPYWTMSDAFVFCDGYHQLGWNPGDDQIEHWLAEHLLAFLLREFPVDYRRYSGPYALERDGSICRLPTDDEFRGFMGKVFDESHHP